MCGGGGLQGRESGARTADMHVSSCCTSLHHWLQPTLAATTGDPPAHTAALLQPAYRLPGTSSSWHTSHPPEQLLHHPSSPLQLLQHCHPTSKPPQRELWCSPTHLNSCCTSLIRSCSFSSAATTSSCSSPAPNRPRTAAVAPDSFLRRRMILPRAPSTKSGRASRRSVWPAVEGGQRTGQRQKADQRQPATAHARLARHPAHPVVWPTGTAMLPPTPRQHQRRHTHQQAHTAAHLWAPCR